MSHLTTLRPPDGPIAPESLPALERARRSHHADELCLAAVQALTGRPELRRRGPAWYAGDDRLRLPASQLHPRAEEDTWADFRGAADGVAQWLTLSDPELYAEQSPPGAGLAAVVFATLEQIRVEALAPDCLPGLRHNLARRHRSWVQRLISSGLTEGERGLHVLAVDLTARVHVLGFRIDDDLADLVEATRWGLAGQIGADLRALRRHLDDQRTYGDHALRIARAVADRLEVTGPEQVDDTDSESLERPGFSLLAGFEDGDEDTPLATAGRSRTLHGARSAYRVFTTAYDRVEAGADAARAATLGARRGELDALVRRSGVSVPVLARRLRDLLSAPEGSEWTDGLDHGVVDGRRLTRLVTSPADHDVFRLPEPRIVPTTSVTLLLDLSGSMRMHRDYVGTLTDLLSRALDQARVPHEVLGFTTTTWQGGPARTEWERAGRPRYPGRLAAVRHLVLKESGRSWRRSRSSLAALLVPEVYREGVDGEALQWAAARASALDTPQHLLVVLSDGSPSERSTALANDEHYLGEHLRRVVGDLEQAPGFGVCALGLGLDLSPYYRRSLVVHDPSPAAVHAGVTDLLALIRD